MPAPDRVHAPLCCSRVPAPLCGDRPAFREADRFRAGRSVQHFDRCMPPNFLRLRLSCIARPGSHTHYLLLAHVLSSCCTARQPPPSRQLPPRRRLSRSRQLPRVAFRVPVNFTRVAVACVTSLVLVVRQLPPCRPLTALSSLVWSRAFHRKGSARRCGSFSTPLRSGRVKVPHSTLLVGAREETFHTVDYDPFIKNQLASTQLT